MSMSDPIADMLTRIRNGLGREKPTVAMPYSRLKGDIAEVLKNEGYIEDYEVVEQKPQATLVITLKYIGDRRSRRSVITALERVSKPGRRIYVGKQGSALGAEWDGHLDYDDVQGCYDRPECAAPRCWRRGHLQGLVNRTYETGSATLIGRSRGGLEICHELVKRRFRCRKA